MKKLMALAFALLMIVSTTSCGQQSNGTASTTTTTSSGQQSNIGFKTKLPTFTQARINDGGSDWIIEVQSYEISGDMIYIQGSDGINVLVSVSNCILVDTSGSIAPKVYVIPQDPTTRTDPQTDPTSPRGEDAGLSTN
jgi:hypothetical protein